MLFHIVFKTLTEQTWDIKTLEYTLTESFLYSIYSDFTIIFATLCPCLLFLSTHTSHSM